MNSGNSSFWFTLSKYVYVSFNTNAPLLLYNTDNGNSLVVSNAACLDIVHKVYGPSNLGVIEIEPKNLDTEVLEFIEKSISLGIGMKMEKSSSTSKPINLLPILNLQNDVEKLISTGETHLIGDHISYYLTSLTLYITNQCNQNCEHCGEYFRQTHFCTKAQKGSFLSPETIKEIFDQSAPTQLKKVNIIGGNIALYPKWHELLHLLNKHFFDCHLWFHLLHLKDVDLDSLSGHKEILVTHPFDKGSIEKALEMAGSRKDISFNFLIEGEQAFSDVNDLLSQYDQINFELIPFYNGKNIDFISKNVFLEKSDILSEKIEMRKIFCNQKLNAAFFGSLFISPDGSVKANPNTPVIGNFTKNSLNELIYNELVSNTAWRNVRNGEKCTSCIYRFLCPPPGNLEFILEKQDLCHVAAKIEKRVILAEKDSE